MPETHERHQYFHFGAWLFDVSHALRILAAVPRPVVALAVEPWAQTYGLDDNTASLLHPRDEFDREYAMTTDLTVPVVVASIGVLGEPNPARILIDGMHRLYRAHAEGFTFLPALVLSVEETGQIRSNVRP